MGSEKTKNTIVGLTVLAALVALMYGILFLGKSPSFGPRRAYAVTLVAQNAGGAAAGAKVDLNGVNIGQVESVYLGPDSKGVLQAKIVLQVNRDVNIPRDSSATLGKPVGVGAPYVSLSSSNASGPFLTKDGKDSLVATPADTSLIPKELRDNVTTMSAQLQVVARDLHVLLAYNTPEQVDATQPAATQNGTGERPVENISTLVIRLNRTVKSLETLLTDKDLQGQVRQIVQNVRDASVKLNGALDSIDTTIKNADTAFSSFGNVATNATKTLDNTQAQILRVSEKLVDMLSAVEKTTKQLAEGGGTTGKLINDPRLYEGLVDLSKSMRSTVNDLDFLLKKWKDEGVNFHLK